MERIASMRCICCELLEVEQDSKTDVHHIREGRIERNDFLTIPLCHDSCHQGRLGVHGTKALLHTLKMSEFELLAIVISRL
jgi:hypothetical protein